MGTLTALPTLPSNPSDSVTAEGSLKNVRTGFLRVLETACRARILGRYPPSRRWPEEELTEAILKEAEGELIQIRAALQQLLEAKEKTSR